MLGNKIQFKSANEATTFTINDLSTNNLNASPYYYINVATVDGLWGADIAYESHPIPNAVGEKSGDVFRRGKTITLTGKIHGRGLAELYEGARYLQQMFAETALRKLLFQLWNDGFQTYLKCRISQDLVIVENINSTNYRWDWTVGLRADDPRTYKASDNSLYPTWQQ